MKKSEVEERAVTRSRRVIFVKAPLVGRGWIRFVEVIHGKWFCDECLERVVPSQFEQHGRKH